MPIRPPTFPRTRKSIGAGAGLSSGLRNRSGTNNFVCGDQRDRIAPCRVTRDGKDGRQGSASESEIEFTVGHAGDEGAPFVDSELQVRAAWAAGVANGRRRLQHTNVVDDREALTYSPMRSASPTGRTSPTFWRKRGGPKSDPPRERPVSGLDAAELEVAVPHTGKECRPLTYREAEHGTFRVLGVANRDVVTDSGGLYTRPRIAMPAALPGQRWLVLDQLNCLSSNM